MSASPDPRRTLLRLGWVQTILFGLLALLVNHLSYALSIRWDLTADQRHSLSDVAIDSVSHLDRPLIARVFFSEGLDAPYHDHRRALLDKLTELSAHASGRLVVHVVDPTGDPDAVAEAARYGVRPLPYAFRSWDRTEARTVYMGLALLYGEQQVAVDALPSIPDMESELARAIRRVSTPPDDTRSVGWLLGHGEPDPTQGQDGTPLAALVEGLAEVGRFRTLAPADAPIPEDLDVLMIVAPQQPLAPVEVAHLDRFLSQGGAIMLWLSQIQPDFEAGHPREVDHGLRAWMGHHGVRLNRDVVLDRDHAEQMVVPMEVEGLGRQLVRLHYPLALTTTALDRTRREVRDLPQMLLPFVSTITVDPERTADLDPAVWVQTMPSSVAVRGLTTLDPKALRQPLPDEVAGPHPVAVALSGRFSGWFLERPLPDRLDPQQPPLDRDDWRDPGRPARMVVVHSGDALANNLDFAQNAVDWLAEDPALIGIRSRGHGVRPMSPPPRSAAMRAKLAVVGVPLGLLALIALIARRRGRR